MNVTNNITVALQFVENASKHNDCLSNPRPLSNNPKTLSYSSYIGTFFQLVRIAMKMGWNSH